jgi:hypothetical protein
MIHVGFLDESCAMHGRSLRRAIAVAVELGLVALMPAACGIGGSWTIPPRSTTTLTFGWEYHFAMEWTVVTDPNGTRRIEGYVANLYGQYAEPVRVLGEALDASGHAVVQRLSWVLGGVPGGGRTYFEINGLPVTDAYQVTIWDYSFRRKGV